jgi:hypothetical protein
VRECRREKQIEHVLHEAQETGHGKLQYFTMRALALERSPFRRVPMFRQRGTTDPVSVVVDGPGLYPSPMLA